VLSCGSKRLQQAVPYSPVLSSARLGLVTKFSLSPVTHSISLFEKREELRRVLESKHFAGSPKKTRFLEFVSEQAFLGNGEKLNEYLIGVEVYERGSDFNPQKDPIVRVQAHEIRRQLKKHYEEDGKDRPLRIDLPSGHYVPVFSRSMPEEPVVAEASADTTNVIWQRAGRWHLVLTITLAAVCLVLIILLVTTGRRNERATNSRPPTAVLPESLDWFWRPFLPPAAPPLVIIPNHPLLRAAHEGDSAQTLASGHDIPKSSLPEFRETIHFRELKRFLFVPSLTDFTSVGETMGVISLCEMFSSVGQKCRVQQSRLANFEEIKQDNAILLGGNQAWSGRVFLNVEGFHFQSGVILNRNPRPGEKAVYKPEFDSVTNQLTRDYALVLMVPNERKENRVLLIYGIYTQGSQAAIEYLKNPEHMTELRKALMDLSPDHKAIPPYFQALLTTTVENSVPGNSALVAVRVIAN